MREVELPGELLVLLVSGTPVRLLADPKLTELALSALVLLAPPGLGLVLPKLAPLLRKVEPELVSGLLLLPGVADLLMSGLLIPELPVPVVPVALPDGDDEGAALVSGYIPDEMRPVGVNISVVELPVDDWLLAPKSERDSVVAITSA